MSGRYKAIYRNQNEHIGVNCPISLLAQALLIDTLENKKLAQLKLCNCSSKVVESVKITIKAYGQGNTLTEEIDSYEYMGLSINPGGIFGSQNPIYFFEADLITSIEVFINEVHFKDSDVWISDSKTPLIERPEKESISSFLPNDLVNEYRGIINGKADYVPVEYGDSLWACSCGTLNAYRDTCRFCEAKKSDIFEYYDRDKLQDIIDEKTYGKACKLSNDDVVEKKSISDLTTAIELFNTISYYKDSSKKAAELTILLNGLKERKNKQQQKRLKWGIVLGVITALIVLIAFKIFIPANTYSKAIKAMELNDYDTAISEFESIKDYKDSAEKIDECRGKIIDLELSKENVSSQVLLSIPEEYYRHHQEKSYACGERLVKSQRWDDAEKFFIYSGTYESSNKYLKYISARKALDASNDEEAIAILESILGFLDADELLGDEYIKEIMATEEMSVSAAVELLSKPSSLSSEAEAFFTEIKSLSWAEGNFKGSHRYKFDGIHLHESAPSDDNVYNGELSVYIYLHYGVASANVYTELLPYAHDYSKDCKVVRINDMFNQNDIAVEIPIGAKCDYISLQNYRAVYIEADNTLTYFNKEK